MGLKRGSLLEPQRATRGSTRTPYINASKYIYIFYLGNSANHRTQNPVNLTSSAVQHSYELICQENWREVCPEDLQANPEWQDAHRAVVKEINRRLATGG